MRTFVAAAMLLLALGAKAPDSYRPYVPYDPFGWGHRWGADAGTGGDAGDPCDPNPCEHGTCSPSGGGYSCECESGWEGTNCDTDVNECLTENGGCSAVATCTNTEGSRTCACNSGWTGNGVTCTNEDECARDAGVCDLLTSCTDNDGGYVCGDCPTPGYNAGPGYVADGGCTNVNECDVDAGGYCQNGASCSDTDGGYACTCTHDWTGTNCTSESGTAASIAWKATWTASPSTTYIDTTSGSPTATSPTVECWASQYSGGSTWPCTGWTLSKNGTVTTPASPFYSSGFSTNIAAVNTATGSFAKSDPGSWNTDFTVWGLFSQTSTGTQVFFKKANGSTVDWYAYSTNTGTVGILVYNEASQLSVISGTGGALGVWNTFACRYHAVGDGTSTGRCAVNGTLGSAVTNAKLVRNTASSSITVLANSIYNVGAIDGTALTDAQLQNITKSLRGLIPVTGNSAIAFTRASTAACQPTSTSGIFYLAPNFPCIGEKGLRVYGAYVLKGRYSEAFDSWTGTGTGSDAPAVTANTGDTTAPDGASTAELVAFKEVDHSGDVSDLKSPTAVTLSATSWTHAVYAKSVSGTTTVRIGWRTSDSTTCSYTDCSVGASAWTRCVHTATATAAEYVPFIGNNRICDNTARTEQQVYLWGETFSNNDEVVPYSVVTTADSSIPASDFSFTSQQTLGEVCYAAKVGPDMTSTHAAGALGIFAHDTYGAGADDRGARVTGTSATGIIQDHTGGATRTGTATVGGLNNASAQTIKVCYDLDNHVKIVDGTSIKTTTMSGSGNGTASAVPTTIYIGQDQSTYLGWYLLGFSECNNYGSAGCTP